mmetsp:Transcript_52513/g.125458  ORF Transcript_52513/g.125458 Transcript_52513/m.125458 type:complete len:133 (-) Transcript_52513:140-538(-)
MGGVEETVIDQARHTGFGACMGDLLYGDDMQFRERLPACIDACTVQLPGGVVRKASSASVALAALSIAAISMAMNIFLLCFVCLRRQCFRVSKADRGGMQGIENKWNSIISQSDQRRDKVPKPSMIGGGANL